MRANRKVVEYYGLNKFSRLTFCRQTYFMGFFSSFHRAFCGLFNYTHQNMHMYILFKKSKIYVRTFKTLLHVSIPRSFSGNIYCSLLKLRFKTFSELLHYVNFGVAAACRVFVCVSRTVFRMSFMKLILNSVRLTHTNKDLLPQHQS